MKCEHCGTDVPSHELGRAEYHDCLEDMPIGGDMGGVHTKQMVEDLVSGQEYRGLFVQAHDQSFRILELEAEINRLRAVIEDESEKWHDHHTDPAKKAYWSAFGRKAKP